MYKNVFNLGEGWACPLSLCLYSMHSARLFNKTRNMVAIDCPSVTFLLPIQLNQEDLVIAFWQNIDLIHPYYICAHLCSLCTRELSARFSCQWFGSSPGRAGAWIWRPWRVQVWRITCVWSTSMEINLHAEHKRGDWLPCEHQHGEWLPCLAPAWKLTSTSSTNVEMAL